VSEEGRYVRFKRWAIKKLLILLALTGVTVTCYFALAANEKYAVYVNFFEKTAPNLEILSNSPGVGINGATIRLKVEDKGTGLDEVIIRSDQDGEVRDLLKKQFPEPKFSDVIELKIRGKDSGLSEGPIDLNISVFDRSFWSNGLKKEIPLNVSFERPRLEVVSAQHNAVVGGAELCFYRVSKLEEGISGVRVGDVEFPGYPARLLDAAFEATPDLYFALFAIPIQYQKERDTIRAFARNSVGNETSHPFYYKVQPIRYTRRTRELDPLYVETKLLSLEERLRELNPTLTYSEKERFSTIIGSLRKLNEREIRSVLRNPELHSSWEGSFQRPPGASLRVDFGEIRDYLSSADELMGSFVYTGAEHSAPTGLSVVPVAPGKVKFEGDLPLYGKTVIVDHGFGLSSLYGFLDSTKVRVGSDVGNSSEIGKVGISGFVDTTALLIEIRINGVPVRPIEWWDARWVQDHIRRKIDDIKKQLNLLPENGEEKEAEE